MKDKLGTDYKLQPRLGTGPEEQHQQKVPKTKLHKHLWYIASFRASYM